EKAHAQLVLELGKRQRQRGLRDEALLRRAAEVPFLGQRDDIAEFGEGHGGYRLALAIASITTINWTNQSPWLIIAAFLNSTPPRRLQHDPEQGRPAHSRRHVPHPRGRAMEGRHHRAALRRQDGRRLRPA